MLSTWVWVLGNHSEPIAPRPLWVLRCWGPISSDRLLSSAPLVGRSESSPAASPHILPDLGMGLLWPQIIYQQSKRVERTRCFIDTELWVLTQLWATPGTLFNFSKHQILYLWNGNEDNTIRLLKVECSHSHHYFMGLVEGWREMDKTGTISLTPYG